MCFRWHIWVIKQNKYDDVMRALEEVEEVDRFVYPTAVVEYKTKSGIKKKRSPLYSGYLFIRYRDHDTVFHKLNVLPFFTTYVGTCTGEDLKRIEEVERLEEWNVVNKSVRVDDTVVVTAGPFKGFSGSVVEVTSSSLVCLLQVLGRKARTQLSKEDVDVVKRG